MFPVTDSLPAWLPLDPVRGPVEQSSAVGGARAPAAMLRLHQEDARVYGYELRPTGNE